MIEYPVFVGGIMAGLILALLVCLFLTVDDGGDL